MSLQHLPPIRAKGCANFRLRVIFATLSGRRLRIDEIRHRDQSPGLRDFEANFLRLVEKLTNGCSIEINETGTSLRYSPGFIAGGKVEHDCGLSRSIGYFLEGILPLLPFARKETLLALSGITGDDVDPSVDFIKQVVLPILPHFGVKEGLELNILKRGAPPLGGGFIKLSCPVVRELNAISLTDEGYVKRVRGIAFACRVSPQMSNRIVDGVRGMLNPFLPDVYVYTDHTKGAGAGQSPGYGVALVASTTSGCVFGSQRDSGLTHGVFGGSVKAPSSTTPDSPEDMGAESAALLLEEINRGGCIDTSAQSLCFTLMLLSPRDVSRVRIGKLSPAGVATLRLIKEFFGVVFYLAAETKEVVAESINSTRKSSSSLKNKQEEDVDDEEVEVLGEARKRKRGAPSIQGSLKRGTTAISIDPTTVTSLSKEATGGHSGKTVLVSCMGMGYRNLSKKVT